MSDPISIHILLADDDTDDCNFFNDALAELPIVTNLTSVYDGEQLINYFATVTENVPHVLFLDHNMPRKNGFECLTEIKKHALHNKIPVIIYSTTFDEQKAKQLFDIGADYYICKPADFEELKKVIHNALLLVQEGKIKPLWQNFLLKNTNTFPEN